jgi:hypothetical protein
MSVFLNRILPFAISLTLGLGLTHIIKWAESNVGAVDPNIMGSLCPGGKDWDLPGSSCHNGWIFDRMPPIADEIPTKKVVRKKKKGR